MDSITFNPQEFSSRKLWQLVTTDANSKISDDSLAKAIAELARRRHYLEQLQDIGALKRSGPDTES